MTEYTFTAWLAIYKSKQSQGTKKTVALKSGPIRLSVGNSQFKVGKHVPSTELDTATTS